MMSGGKGWGGFLKACIVSGIMAVGGLALSTSIGMWLLKK